MPFQDSPKTTLQIAVAGAGLIGRRHIDLIQANPDTELVAIVDPDPAAALLATEWGVAHFEDIEALFQSHRPDGAILATPNHLHVSQALTCLKAGVPALIEKPVAHTLADGERLHRIAQQSRVKLLVGHHRAHSPILTRAREVIHEGLIGEPVAVMGSALFYKPDSYFDQAPWRREAGGGPILINLIHEIGNLRSLLGEVTAVQAMASNVTRGFSVEDTVTIGLRFANGALGSFLISDTAAAARSWEQTTGEDPSYANYPNEECYLLAGTKGSLAVPTLRLKRYGNEAIPSWWTPFEEQTIETRRDDPLACQLSHFVEVIRGNDEPLVNVHDGLQNLRVVEAISQAARQGSTLTLTLDPM